MTKDINIEIPGPEMKITITPPEERGLPYKAAVRLDWSEVFAVEDTDWNRLIGKLNEWLGEAASSTTKLRLQLSNVQPPALPEPPEQAAALSGEETAKLDEVVATHTGEGWGAGKEEAR